jgi:hypothetical protein
LADWLDADACDLQTPRLAAAELRRLHAVNAELLERLKVVAWTLNLVHPYGVPDVLHEGSAFRKSIIAAIAKAEGVKP